MSDVIRVFRMLEYTGTPAGVQEAIEKRGVKELMGSIKHCRIREAFIGTMSCIELLDDETADAIGLQETVKASGGLKCPNCEDVGYTVEHPLPYGEPEQVQCEFCYMIPDSIFNRSQKCTS